MAVLAISVLGAVGGQAIGIGASAGWLVGSLVGNALFAKGQKTEGPRMTDLQVQSAAEGAPIPIAYGTGRLAGNMIWSSGILETKTKQKTGGKGMGGKSTHTTYTYRASFAISLCEGTIIGVRKIWADGKLIYNVGASGTSAITLYTSRNKAATIAVYTGSGSQAADATIQSYEGAANTPAFRNVAYLVFTDFQLADFGNRIPNITAEVIAGGSVGTAPYRVNTWASATPDMHQGRTIDGVLERVTGAWVNTDYAGDDYYTLTLTTNRYTLDGALVSTTAQSRTYFEMDLAGDGFASPTIRPVTEYPQIAGSVIGGGTDSGHADLYVGVNGIGHPNPIDSADYNGALDTTDSPGMVYLGGFVFTIQSGSGGTKGIARYNVVKGVIGLSSDKLYRLTSTGGEHLAAGSDGLLYVYDYNGNINGSHIVSFDTDLNIVASYNYPGGYDRDTGAYMAIYNGLLMDTEIEGGHTRLRLWTMTATLTYVGQVAATTSNDLAIRHIGNGLVIHETGVFSMLPPLNTTDVTLSSIVADLCQRVGLQSANRDVTALASDTVPFFAVGRPMAVRAALEPLRQAYFFDGVESATALKFVKRGGASVATLTADDLGFENDSNALTQLTRQQEYELPVQINIGYWNIGNDYQPGLESFRRLITPSKQTAEIDLPLGLTSTKAAQIAEVLMLNAWEERARYVMRATRKHVRLEPTDIITLPDGELARIIATDYADDGSLRIEAYADAAGRYSAVAVGGDAGLETPQDVPAEGPTDLLLLDMPAFETKDNRPGLYIAASGYYSGWRGAEILASTDGVVYESIYGITDAAVRGYATTALAGSSNCYQTDLASTVTITLTDSADSLSSITEDQMLAGGNLCALKSGTGWEILQFQTATLITGSTYRLSKLLRGRFNTESYAVAPDIQAQTDGHVIGDPFILITVEGLNFVERPQGDVASERFYKAATFGASIEDATEHALTLVGNSQKPFAPQHLSGGPNYSGDWAMAWDRRARTDFWWLNYRDVPLDEDTEAYRVQILNPATLAVVREIDSTTETASYTLAQQVTDWGAAQGRLTWQVCQRSADIGDGNYGRATNTLPTGGRYFNYLKSLNPALLVYSWTSTTVGNDESPHNLDGSWTGTPTVNVSSTPVTNDQGAVIRSCTLAGTQRCTFTDHTGINPKREVTVFAWVNWTSTGSQWIIGKYQSVASSDKQYLLYIDASAGEVGFLIRTAALDQKNITIDLNLHDGNWHLIVGTCEEEEDGTRFCRLFTDGVQRTSGTHLFDDDLLVTTTPIVVGADNTGAQPLTGSLGPVGVLGYALTPTEVATMYSLASYT